MISNILILAAGEGTRLRPLTSENPKPLLELDDNKTTILDRLIGQCRKFLPGIPLHINIGFCAEEILFHFKEVPYIDRPIFLYEKEILGPAQTLVQFSKIEHGMTLVIHGDLVLSDQGFSKFVKYIANSVSQVIVCHERPRFQARSEVIRSLNKKKMSSIKEFSQEEYSNSNRNVLVSSGIFVVDLAKVSTFKAEPKLSLSPDLLNFINDEEMDVYVWVDWRYAIDSLAILQEARFRVSTINNH
jgi:NDP-sugar pyrophosphorylase family protein